MSVLKTLIDERAEFSESFQIQQRRRNRIMALQSILLLLMGMLAVMYYNSILTAVMVWFNVQ